MTSWRFIRNLSLCLVIYAYAPVLIAQAGSSCSSTIRAINVSGAKVTKQQNLIIWSGLQVGQQVTATDLLLARQELFDKGLFKEVSIEQDAVCADSVTITITIEEKFYHLVYPRLSRNADGDVSTGIRYRGSNLFGADQSLKIRYTEKDYDSGDEKVQADISHRIPMISQPYTIRWSAKTSERLDNDNGNEIQEITDGFKINVERDWLTNPFSKSVTVQTELRFEQLELEGDYQALNTVPGNYNTLGISVVYDDIHEEKYRRYGQYYKLELAKGLSVLDSDFFATQIEAAATWLMPLNPTDNLNTRIIIELSSDKVFNEYVYSIGGYEKSRGIEEGSKSGNALWIANIEYVKGYQRWPSFRTALFTDISNIFEEATTLNSDDWNATLGVGLRWKLTSFVDTDLVLDYAYDPQTGFSKVYGSTSLLF